VRVVDKEGRKITPTEFVQTYVLHRSGAASEAVYDDVAMAIETHFPSVKAWTLPLPTDDPDVLQNIETNEAKLTPKFHREVASLLEFLKSDVAPKQGFVRATRVNGPTLVGLAEQFVKYLNEPNAVPCLDNIWATVVDNKRRGLIATLSERYKKEMAAFVAGRAMEEEDIINKHYQLFEGLADTLTEEVCLI